MFDIRPHFHESGFRNKIQSGGIEESVCCRFLGRGKTGTFSSSLPEYSSRKRAPAKLVRKVGNIKETCISRSYVGEMLVSFFKDIPTTWFTRFQLDLIPALCLFEQICAVTWVSTSLKRSSMLSCRILTSLTL